MKVKLLKTTGFGRGYDAQRIADDAKNLNVLIRLYNAEPSEGLKRALWEIAKRTWLEKQLGEAGLPGAEDA